MSDKILCLADLHINTTKSLELSLVKKIIHKEKPALILIAGDVFESDITFNPYKELATLNVPTVCCFGNHEFAFRTVSATHEFYRSQYNPDKYDVHYLDIIGHKEVELNGKKINIVGNVLWYDTSLKDVPSQPNDMIIPTWLDSTIRQFNFIKANIDCRNQILSNLNKDDTILLTHCVPNVMMNDFSIKGPSQYNMYSGMKDFLKDIVDKCSLKWSVCGHTHVRIDRTKESDRLYNVSCINVGNDYLFRGDEIKYFMIEDI